MTKQPSAGTGFYSGGGHAAKLAPPPQRNRGSFVASVAQEIPTTIDIRLRLNEIIDHDFHCLVNRDKSDKAFPKSWSYTAKIIGVTEEERDGIYKDLIPRVGPSSISSEETQGKKYTMTVKISDANIAAFKSDREISF